MPRRRSVRVPVGALAIDAAVRCQDEPRLRPRAGSRRASADLRCAPWRPRSAAISRARVEPTPVLATCQLASDAAKHLLCSRREDRGASLDLRVRRSPSSTRRSPSAHAPRIARCPPRSGRHSGHTSEAESARWSARGLPRVTWRRRELPGPDRHARTVPRIFGFGGHARRGRGEGEGSSRPEVEAGACQSRTRSPSVARDHERPRPASERTLVRVGGDRCDLRPLSRPCVDS